ncbi:MAG TPA: hypothetical protein EYH30_10570 [Anaerolineales bacterium]|nr:hypothetical protein [Anaerolineae bacterium]HIQ02544.1 hypothetical protein [Anaerolineales bacterium]
MTTVDEILTRIRAHLDLEAETEHEVLEEIRAHLEAAVEDARARGLDEESALIEAAARFGVEDVADELQATHAGWGTLEGIAAAGLPVLFALVLRWTIFAPDGTTVGWREMLNRPALWAVAAIALLFPLLRFPRRRYALIAWTIFWGLSVLIAVAQAVHW